MTYTLSNSTIEIECDITWPELRKVAERIAALIEKWDERVYDKHLARTKQSHDDTSKLFDDLRTAHRACTVTSLTNHVFDRKLVLECERGGDLTLTLTIDPKHPDIVTTYGFESHQQGNCPIRKP